MPKQSVPFKPAVSRIITTKEVIGWQSATS